MGRFLIRRSQGESELISMPMTSRTRKLTSSISILGAALALASASFLTQAQDAPAAAQAPVNAVMTSATGVSMVGELSNVPAPVLGARAWISLDMNSGQVIAAQ